MSFVRKTLFARGRLGLAIRQQTDLELLWFPGIQAVLSRYAQEQELPAGYLLRAKPKENSPERRIASFFSFSR